jgi:hypothetical protein
MSNGHVLGRTQFCLDDFVHKLNVFYFLASLQLFEYAGSTQNHHNQIIIKLSEHQINQ